GMFISSQLKTRGTQSSMESSQFQDLCLKARQCVSTPWPTSVWSSMGHLPTKKGPTTSGWRTLGKFPTLDLAL
ncbi:hypothetical protein ATANTOWER_000182, partial [Ataeniobius toweri]|nr:hypothetical protein [Ataeniobius toweri]